jgi:integrase/recombinase XerD
MKSPDLGGWIQRFFQEYLVRQRNVSPATVAAYRDTFRLLLHYWQSVGGSPQSTSPWTS